MSVQKLLLNNRNKLPKAAKTKGYGKSKVRQKKEPPPPMSGTPITPPGTSAFKFALLLPSSTRMFNAIR